MKNWWNKYGWGWLLILVFGLYFWPYFREGLPVTHDGENHVARFAQYYLALKQGQLVPRLAPSLQNGFGYPVFNFNYPLANILSLPLSVMKVHYELSFKLIVMFFYVVGGIGVWQWLKKLIPELKKPLIPLLSFWWAPYLYQAIFYRGNIGEVIVFCLVPIILWQIERYRENLKGSAWWLILLLTGFFLSHNIMVLLLTPLLIVYAFWRLKTKKFKINFLVTFVMSVFLSLWFWLPALMEKSLIVLDGVQINEEYVKHFISLDQLFRLSFDQGFSVLGMVDGLSYGLGLLFIMFFLVNIVLLFDKNSKYFYNKKLSLTISLVILIAIFGQLECSQWWWKTIPFLNYVQFPWRLSLFLNLILVWQLALLKMDKNKKIYFWLVIFIIQGVMMIEAWPKNFYSKSQEDYLNCAQTTTILGENRPKTFVYEITKREDDQPKVFQGVGEVTEIKKNNSTVKKYKLDCQTECLIIEETAYFMGFETKVDEQKVNYVDGEKIGGRIAYKVSMGSHWIETKFTQNTWARLLGSGIFVISLFIILSRRKKINKNQW